MLRPYRLLRDGMEHDGLGHNKFTEGIPTTFAGFKDHLMEVRTYDLSTHTDGRKGMNSSRISSAMRFMFPKDEEGKFRGVSIPTSNWRTAEKRIRVGRQVKEGMPAMKWVKQRAVSIHRYRGIGAYSLRKSMRHYKHRIQRRRRNHMSHTHR